MAESGRFDHCANGEVKEMDHDKGNEDESGRKHELCCPAAMLQPARTGRVGQRAAAPQDECATGMQQNTRQ